MAIPALALRIVKILTLLAWAAFAVWAFAFSFSSSFFHYAPHSRLPPFFAAWAGAVVLPISAHLQWSRVARRGRSPLLAWFLHGVTAAACVLPMMAVAAVLSRAPSPWRPSADDAMGAGIDFMVLTGMAIASGILLGLALLVRSWVVFRRSA